MVLNIVFFTAFLMSGKVFLIILENQIVLQLLKECWMLNVLGDGQNTDPQSMDYPNGLP